MEPREITVYELKDMLAKGHAVQLLDVREPTEYSNGYIKKSLRIPLETLPSKHSLVSRQLPVVVYCHHGIESLMAVEYLSTSHGFSNLFLLQGGLHAWATEVGQAVGWY